MVRYALTGTPGTGKTSISKQLNKKILHLSDLYSEASEGKNSTGEWLIDLEKLNGIVNKSNGSSLIIEGHLSHTLKNIEQIIVLRCDPNVLRLRLEKRAYSEVKIKENLEAEAIGIIYSEALKLVDKTSLALPLMIPVYISNSPRIDEYFRIDCLIGLNSFLKKKL